MRTIKALILTSAFFSIGGSAQAEYRLGTWDLSGSAFLGARMASGDSEQHALFNKYTDIQDGIYGNLGLHGEKDNYAIDLQAKNIGRKDQEYRLNGGLYGGLSWELFYNEIINRKASYGVRGPWDGIGTADLTPAAGLTFTTSNPEGIGFRPFEFSIDRKQFGVALDVLKDSPFVARIGYHRENQTGIRAWGITPAMATGPQVYEVPEPIDYKTDNVHASLGHRTDWNAVSLDAAFSSFGNNLRTMTWTPTNPTENPSSLKDTALLAQDNKFWDLELRDTVSDLPLQSTFTAKLGYSRITSKFDVLNSSNSDLLYSTANNNAANRLLLSKITTVVTDRPDFDGKVEYKSADFALASRPVGNLDTKLFYGYLNKKNSSSQVTYTGFPSMNVTGGTATGDGTSGNFGYFKHHAGAEAYYKLIASTKLGLAYDFMNVHRPERHPNPNSRQHKVTLSVKNNSLDWLTSKFRLSYAARLAEYGDETGTDFYDAAAKRTTTAAIDLDAMPTDSMDIGLMGSYSYGRYLDTTLSGPLPGRFLDRKADIAANVGYQFGETVHLGLYGELEKFVGETEIHHPSTFDDKYYTFGTDIRFPIVKEVADFTAGYQYHRGNGRTEGQEYTPGFSSASPQYGYIDDYTRHSVNATVSYKVIANLTAKVGYMFSKLRHLEDRNLVENNAYSYHSTAKKMTLSGATNDWQYLAHVGFVGAEYSF